MWLVAGNAGTKATEAIYRASSMVATELRFLICLRVATLPEPERTAKPMVYCDLFLFHIMIMIHMIEMAK